MIWYFREPTITVRLSLLGASQLSSTLAITPDGNSMVTKATSVIPGRMESRPFARNVVGGAPSQ